MYDYYTLTRMAIIKKTVPSVDKHVEKLGPLSITGGNPKQYNHFGKQFI